MVGVILAILVQPLLAVPIWLWTLLGSVCLFGLFRSASLVYHQRWVYGVLLSVLLAIIGVVCVNLKTGTLRPNNIYHLKDGVYKFEAKALDVPEHKQKAVSILAEVKKVWSGGKAHDITGKALINLPLSDRSAKLKYGDHFMVDGSLQTPRSPMNPGEFNYKRYLAYQQVYKLSFIREDDKWDFTGENSGNVILAKVFNLRIRMLEMLKSIGFEGEDYAVASALILGHKSDLEEDTLQAYVGSGAMHILAVSGLHVGIIYLLLTWVLGFLDRFRKGNVIRAVLIISTLTVYALLTGLSPSVNRAVVMFSFVVLAVNFNRQTQILNTLALSALILMLFDPYLITKVGFQLSYLAVIGIVSLYPKIYRQWGAPNRVMNWLWQITCVSVAAQLATFPLSLYYFQQFPNYFLLFNPVTLGGATLVVSGGLLFFAFAWFPLLHQLFGAFLKFLVHTLNSVVKLVDLLPYATTSNIHISLFEVMVLYGLIVVFIFWLTTKRFKSLTIVLGLVLLLSAYQLVEAITRYKQKNFTVYSLNGTTAFEFTQGRKNIFLAPQALVSDQNALHYSIGPNWQNKGVKTSELLNLEHLPAINTHWLIAREHIFRFEKTTVVLVYGDNLPFVIHPEKPIEVDYVLVSGNPYLFVKDIGRYYDFKTIIFDGSNSNESIDRWVKECEKLQVEYKDVKRKGAFRVNL